jgi:branched-chain amino acid transport system ATP-binding protein
MALLEACELVAFYGKFQALFGVSLTLEAGETVAIIGANGAGKSTFLKSIVGLVRSPSNTILFDGARIDALTPAEILRRGIALVPEGRRLFPTLTVEENLLIGGDFLKQPRQHMLDTVYELFPMLAERRHAPSTTLSGGQQQMAAIGRALMSRPRLLLCDELSLGLAPRVIRDIYAALPRIKAQGTTVVVVEQDIAQALAAADRVYCFQEGRISLAGRAATMSRDEIHSAYFGL